ncbi:hypothetical protein CQW23_03812, partial [Capsicum baccatum]
IIGYVSPNYMEQQFDINESIRGIPIDCLIDFVGITTLLLACKYEEVSVLVVENLILISNKAYARKEVLEMEKLMVNALQFNMTVPTTYVFIRWFLKASQSDKKCTLGVSREWNATCEKHSSYGKNQILECSKLMVFFHQKAEFGKLTGVHQKYSTSKYGNAARCEPTSFLLEAWF